MNLLDTKFGTKSFIKAPDEYAVDTGGEGFCDEVKRV